MAAIIHPSGKTLCKSNAGGIEIPSDIVWRGWEPGREYTKPLTLKNVKFKTQKLKFRLPSHVFSTEYPQSIVLSAGTSYTLPITFRPLEKKEYVEFIEFEALSSQGQHFKVPFRAHLPTPELSLPESVAFGMCGVKDHLNMTLEITNIGDTATDYVWEVPNPFTVSPSSGTLPPKATGRMEVTFSPETAHAFEADAVCRFGEGEQHSRTMKLEGVGKYPHLVARVASKPTKKTATTTPGTSTGWQSEVTVNFHEVAVGTTVEKCIEIANVSPVVGHFRLTPDLQGQLYDPVFTCSDTEGSIDPHSHQRIKISFSPHTVGMTSVTSFTMLTVGGVSTTTVKCMGQCKGPVVVTDEDCLSFGNIECGTSATALLRISNQSNVPAVFQIALDRSSVFSPDVLCGCVEGGTVQCIPVAFTPPRPLAYHRWVTILVQHHTPLFVDFIGNAFTETVKPAVLAAKHLHLFKERVKSGLSRYSPEQLQSMIQEGRIEVEEGERLVAGPSVTITNVACGDSGSAYQQVMSEETGLDAGTLPHVSTDVGYLDFDYCPRGQLSEAKVVNISNHTQSKLMCIWMSGRVDAFQVQPEEREIQPGKTASFTVTFKPDKPSQFYAQELECFAFYKSLRDHRQIDSLTMCPPWCTTVRAAGHTFAPGIEKFLPKVVMDLQNILMPATEPGLAVHRTLVMKNVGDSPVLYEFEAEPQGVFSIWPRVGLLQDHYQVFLLKMQPRDVKVYKHILRLGLNKSTKFNQELLVSGSGDRPNVELENEGHLYFRPTCVGSSSTVSYKVHNTSRLPLSLVWKMSLGGQTGVASVSPSSGVMQPFETQYHVWTFSPREQTRHRLSATLHIKSALPQAKVRKQRVGLELHGDGCVGDLLCEPAKVDFGTVIIGTSSSRKLTLTNPSLCNLHYKLYTEQAHCSEEDSEEDGRTTSLNTGTTHGVELNCSEGVLPAGGQCTLIVTVKPWQRARSQMAIKYKMVLQEDKEGVSTSVASDTCLCLIRVRGVYPTLTVMDIQGEGTATPYSKTHLWSMLSIDRLIHCLKDEPSVEELRYAIATRHSTRRRVPVRTRAEVDFDFGVSPVRSPPTVIHLMLHNDGDTPTEWAFQFPEDMYLEPEYWADKGELDEVEQHELHLMSHNIFQVLPNKGTLEPGEQQQVTLVASHEQVLKGTLPVLLKINRGREVLVNFLSQTIPQEKTVIQLPSEHRLAPVAIGCTAPPRQCFRIQNGCNFPVPFEIDTSPLDTLREENFMMNVLECLQPKGDIPPHGSVEVEFVFSPLEAKRYQVELFVSLGNGQSGHVTFVGDGVQAVPVGEREGVEVSTQLFPVAQRETAVPTQRQVHLSNELAVLSKEQLHFSHLPLFTFSHQLLHINNPSSHTVSFLWELPEQAQEVLRVHPHSGYLQPGTSRTCRVSFFSKSSPAFYELDLLCKVMDETVFASYREALSRWEDNQEERQHLFTVTGREGEVSQEQPTKRPQTMPKLKGMGRTHAKQLASSHRSDTDIRRYQALPPIRSQTADSTSLEYYEDWKKKDLSIRSKSRPRVHREDKEKCPEPPQPYILHLGLTARTHSISDYVKFIKDMNSVHIDSHVLLAGTSKDPGPTTVTDHEHIVLVEVLTQLISDSLHDEDFHSSLQRLGEEPMPYLTQFSDRHRQQDGGGQTALRHMYAAALAEMGSGPHQVGGDGRPEGEESQLPQHEGKEQESRTTSMEDSLDGTAVTLQVGDEEVKVVGASEGLETAPRETELKEEEILKSLPELHHLVENILENTMLNIANEATCGELDFRRPLKTLAVTSQSTKPLTTL